MLSRAFLCPPRGLYSPCHGAHFDVFHVVPWLIYVFCVSIACFLSDVCVQCFCSDVFVPQFFFSQIWPIFLYTLLCFHSVVFVPCLFCFGPYCLTHVLFFPTCSIHGFDLLLIVFTMLCRDSNPAPAVFFHPIMFNYSCVSSTLFTDVP